MQRIRLFSCVIALLAMVRLHHTVAYSAAWLCEYNISIVTTTCTHYLLYSLLLYILYIYWTRVINSRMPAAAWSSRCRHETQRLSSLYRFSLLAVSCLLTLLLQVSLPSMATRLYSMASHLAWPLKTTSAANASATSCSSSDSSGSSGCRGSATVV
jgi:hypothetical protein